MPSHIHTQKFLHCIGSEEFQVLSCWVTKLNFTLTKDSSASREQAGEVTQHKKKKKSLLIFLFKPGFSDYKAAVNTITEPDE